MFPMSWQATSAFLYVGESVSQVPASCCIICGGIYPPLLHHLGPEGQRLFFTHCQAKVRDGMETAIIALKARITPQLNAMPSERALWLPRASVLQYVSVLRDFGAMSEFTSNLDIMLPEQLVENLAGQHIRERLLHTHSYYNCYSEQSPVCKTTRCCSFLSDIVLDTLPLWIRPASR